MIEHPDPIGGCISGRRGFWGVIGGGDKCGDHDNSWVMVGANGRWEVESEE